MYKEVQICIASDSMINYLQIYDADEKIVEAYVNTYFVFKFKVNKAYKIRIMSNNFVLCSSFYVTYKYYGPYIFYLKQKHLSHNIFIKLKDYNYDGLLIEKGKIILWQNNIT